MMMAEDNIPLKKRKSKYEPVQSKQKVCVWVREIKSFDSDGQATISPSQGPYMLEHHLPLSLLFKLWETDNNSDVPFSSWFYATYPCNHPTPFPKPDSSQNEPQQLDGNNTPYSINLQSGTIIFAKTLIILPKPNSENQSPSSIDQSLPIVSGASSIISYSPTRISPPKRPYEMILPDGHDSSYATKRFGGDLKA